MIVGDLIKASYANLGALDIGNDLAPAQYAQGLQSLNSLIGSWGRARLTIYGIVDESFTLIPDKAVYTVGSGGEFDTAWPYEVVGAFIRDAHSIDYPVRIIADSKYDAISLKTIGNRPHSLVYNPKGYPTGQATLFPVPTEAESLFWSARKVLTSYASIEDSVGLAPEYEEALEFNLSLRLAPKCGVAVTPELRELARQSKSVIPVLVEPAKFDGAFGSTGRASTLDGIYSGYL
jgi:hypothetical protein